MPRNTLTAGTIYQTAKMPTMDSKGTVIEVTCHSIEDVVRISGFAKAIADLDLPSQMIDESLFFEGTITPHREKRQGKKASPRTDKASIIHRGNDYITMCLPLDIMSRYELNDRLNRLGWTMRGYSVTDGDKGMVHSEMWFKELLF